MTATSTDVKNRFGEYLLQAQREPVTVQKSGQNVAVLISAAEYDRLRALEDAVWGQKADAAMANGLATDQEVSAMLRKYNEPE